MVFFCHRIPDIFQLFSQTVLFCLFPHLLLHRSVPHQKEHGILLRTNLKYANRKILVGLSLFLYYVSIFTLSYIYNAQMTYAASCFSTKYLLPLLSLLIDPKYAVVSSCLFLSLIHMCDDNLQPHNDVVHSVSYTCRWCVQWCVEISYNHAAVLWHCSFSWNADFLCRRVQCIQ